MAFVFRVFVKTVFLSIVAFGCGGRTESSAQYSISVAFPNLTFTRPVDLQHAGDGTDRVFVVEQAGVIRVFDNSATVSSSKVFLDIHNRVDDSGNEEGLLGLAFHPNYSSTGYLYVNYTATDPNRTVISRFSVSSTDPNTADDTSELVLMTISQPFGNHNGGQIVFGPDGFLYVAVGDGGSGGDPLGHGQNRATLLGSILRIDVDNPSGNRPYGIPSSNPFVNNQDGYREEIFAYGLRNPWRISFDDVTGNLWAGDVGQNKFEEIDIVESGKNYGWNVMEGFECYNSSTCNTDNLELPVHAYPHSNGDISVTGGFVYRGSTLSDLNGTYVYADFGSGRIWGLTKQGDTYNNSLLVSTGRSISSFGLDQSNRLLICSFDGRVYELIETSGTNTDTPTGSMGLNTIDAFPNPFYDLATVRITISSPGHSIVSVYDVLGRTVTRLLDRYLETGNHLATWNGRTETHARVAKGVYFVTMRQNESVASEPILYRPFN